MTLCVELLRFLEEGHSQLPPRARRARGQLSRLHHAHGRLA